MVSIDIDIDVTFVSCWVVSLAVFGASRDCCDDCDGDLAVVVDDDIVSADVSVVFAADVPAVFDVGSHLSEAFNWPSSDEVAFVRFSDDIDNLYYARNEC